MRRSFGVHQAKEGNCFLIPLVKVGRLPIKQAYPPLIFAFMNYFYTKGVVDGDSLKLNIAETCPLRIP